MAKRTRCPVCKKAVTMSGAGTIYGHGTRTDRCPGSGTRVGAVVALLEELRAMEKEHTKP